MKAKAKKTSKKPKAKSPAKKAAASTITESRNPFSGDKERYAIWDALVRRDYEAFLANDWSICAGDFLESEFMAYDACFKADPDHWRLKYSQLKDYRAEWLRQADDFEAVEMKGISKLDFLYKAVVLKSIEIQNNRAVAHKKFNGSVETVNHGTLKLKWQSIFFLKKDRGRWKITGFVGYLPSPMPDNA
ncbi:MAG: hypothetical protein ABIP97_00045 [Chthoniobacterales bacterium]